MTFYSEDPDLWYTESELQLIMYTWGQKFFKEILLRSIYDGIDKNFGSFSIRFPCQSEELFTVMDFKNL